MEVAWYFITIQILALLVSLVVLIFALNTSGNRRMLHGLYFIISTLMLVVSLSLLLPSLEVGGLIDIVDVMVEFLPSCLTVAIGIKKITRSFKFLGTKRAESANT